MTIREMLEMKNDKAKVIVNEVNEPNMELMAKVFYNIIKNS